MCLCYVPICRFACCNLCAVRAPFHVNVRAFGVLSYYSNSLRYVRTCPISSFLFFWGVCVQRDSMDCWVRLCNTSEKEAVNFSLPKAATVSDLLLKSFRTFYKNALSFMKPADMELAANGVSVSNRETVARLFESVAQGTILELRPKGQGAAKYLRAECNPSGSHSPTPGQRTTPSRRICWSPKREAPEENTCEFVAVWGVELCATCGKHRNTHSRFPPTADELQKRCIQRARSASRTPRATTPKRATAAAHAELTSTRSPSPHPNPACASFRAVWGRPAFCSVCGLPESLHTIAAITPETTRSPKHAHSSIKPRPVSCRHKACSSFMPLWNNNEYCGRCYEPLAQHSIAATPRGANESSRLRKAAERKEQRARTQLLVAQQREAEARSLRLCALPWHNVVAYCVIEDLVVLGRCCRLLTLVVRPLLELTMQSVLEMDATEEAKEILRKHAIQVAEALSPKSDTMEALGLLCMQLLHFPHTEAAQLKSFAYRIELVKQVSYVESKSLTSVIANQIKMLEDSVALLDLPREIQPLLAYLKTLYTQFIVHSRATRYLTAPKIPL